MEFFKEEKRVFKKFLPFILLILSLFVFLENGLTETESGKITLCDGTKIYYEAMGDPRHQNILFIHGWSCSSLYWQKQLKGLSSKYYTVAIDLRGHGRSDKPPFGYTLAYMARDVHEFIEKLNLKDVFLVGWSMGGSRVPAYVRSLLIMELFCSDYRSVLSQIDVPTLIILGSWSKKGKGFPVGEYMQKKIRGSRLVLFSKSGHCPFLEEADRFNHVLSEFIEANR